MSAGASRHVSVLLRETVELLQPRAGGVYVDATFGAGGYSRAILGLAGTRVIGIDRYPERLELARRMGVETIDYTAVESVPDALKQMTAGRGPDACIDAVGMEAYGQGLDFMYDRVKQAVMLESDRPHVLREMIYVCRPAGILSVPGVYGGLIDRIPFGALRLKKICTVTISVQPCTVSFDGTISVIWALPFFCWKPTL